MKRTAVVLFLAFPLSLLAQAPAPALPSAPVATDPAAAAQAPATTGGAVTTLQARSNLVVVDVVVTDKGKNAIHGLKASDFVLKEGGEAQTIKSFEEHAPTTAVAGPAQAALPPGVYTNYTGFPDNGPINILLIDRLNTPVASQSFLHQQLVQFLKTMKPGTRLAVFGLNNQLIYLQGFTSDPKLLLAALEAKKNLPRQSGLLDASADSSFSDSMSDMGASASAVASVEQLEAQAQSFATQIRVKYTLDAMNSLSRYLATIPGRKNLLWFSGSFPLTILPDGDLPDPFGATLEMGDEFRETTTELSRAQVSVYPIDARGLQTLTTMDASVGNTGMSKGRNNPGYAGQQMMKSLTKVNDEQMTMRQMAQETGGEAFVNTNGLADAVAKAIDNGSSYYTVTYAPVHPKNDGSFRKIQVAVDKPGVELEYRRGYYTDLPAKPVRRQLTVSTAAAAAAPTAEHVAVKNAMMRGVPNSSQILFKVFVSPLGPPTEVELAPKNMAAPTTKPPYRRYTVNYAASPRDFSFKTLGGGRYGLDLEFVVLVYDSNGTMVNALGSTARANATVDDVKNMLKTGVQFHQEISVPAKGEYFLRIGVHDLLADHIGTVEVPVDAVKGLTVVEAPVAKPPVPVMSDLPK